MEPLFEDSWTLFYKRTFVEDHRYRCPAHLKKVCESVLGTCESLPLAIMLVVFFFSKRQEQLE